MPSAYRLLLALGSGVALLLSACTAPRAPQGSPDDGSGPSRVGTASPASGQAARVHPTEALGNPGLSMLSRTSGRWIRASWEDLPGWADDEVAQVLPALRHTCQRPSAAWRSACEGAKSLKEKDHQGVRLWMLQHLQPWRVEDEQGRREGLLTAYYEPLFEARRTPDRQYRWPVHAPPSDLNQRRPYWSRKQLDTLAPAREMMRERVLAYLKDPVDVLVLQTQGSGRIAITEAEGRQRTVRLAFAGHNDHPYGSVARWLLEQGLIQPAQASWSGIRDWMQRNPRAVQDAIWSNPRVVFFREEALDDPNQGPRGAMGVPLTPGRSIAVDPRSIPLGSLVWMESPGAAGREPLRRAVVAQDTGNAITGAVRADFFTGWGEEAEQRANRTRSALRLWALWPRGADPGAQ